MTLEVNYSDKFLAGLHHSFTIVIDEGLPRGEVLIGDESVPSRVIPLRDPKYKISFVIPAGTAGKELTLRVQTAASELEEKKEITEE